MKIFISALVVVCLGLGSEAWKIFPQMRETALHAIAWVNDSPLWIFGLIILFILLNNKIARGGSK